MSPAAFASRQVKRRYVQTIDAPPDEVFPLVCPVREAEWLEGWRYTMLFSRSGLVELGAVFSTPGEGEADTVWIVTRHNAMQRIVEFTRFTPDSRVSVLSVVVMPSGPSQSRVDITYTYTAIAPAGLRFIEEWTDEKFRDAVTFWERSMNHWLATGKQLARG